MGVGTAPSSTFDVRPSQILRDLEGKSSGVGVKPVCKALTLLPCLVPCLLPFPSLIFTGKLRGSFKVIVGSGGGERVWVLHCTKDGMSNKEIIDGKEVTIEDVDLRFKK